MSDVMESAGRILPMPKLDYDASTTFYMLDIVNHNSATWICRKKCTGQEPSDTNTEYWQRFGGDNAKTLDGHGAEYFAPADEIFSVNFIERHFKANTETELDEYLINLHTNAKEGDWYRGVVRCDVVHSIFGGFTYYVEGFKWTPNFGYQKMTSYTGNGRTFERAIYSGTWGDWRKSANITDLANYLSTAGGTVGRMVVSAERANPLEVQNPAGNNSAVQFTGVNGTLGYIGLNNANNPAYSPSDFSAWYPLLHTGNKPTGTYTGNGDATSRTINIGGIGETLFVNCPQSGFGAIVWYYGALVFGGTSVNHIPDTQANFRNGVLTLATDSGTLNGNGYTNKYQVL